MVLTCPKGLFKLNIYDLNVAFGVLLGFYLVQVIFMIARCVWQKHYGRQADQNDPIDRPYHMQNHVSHAMALDLDMVSLSIFSLPVRPDLKVY